MRGGIFGFEFRGAAMRDVRQDVQTEKAGAKMLQPQMREQRETSQGDLSCLRERIQIANSDATILQFEMRGGGKSHEKDVRGVRERIRDEKRRAEILQRGMPAESESMRGATEADLRRKNLSDVRERIRPDGQQSNLLQSGMPPTDSLRKNLSRVQQDLSNKNIDATILQC